MQIHITKKLLSLVTLITHAQLPMGGISLYSTIDYLLILLEVDLKLVVIQGDNFQMFSFQQINKIN